MQSSCLPSRTLRCLAASALLIGMVATALAELTNEERDIFVKALAHQANGLDERCAYTQVENKPKKGEEDVYEKIAARFDPVANPETPWKLLTIDDRAPSAKEISDYRPNRSHPVFIRFSYPHVNQLKVASKEDDIWVFQGTGDGMTGIPDGGVKKFDEKYDVEFEVHAPTATLRSLRATLKKPFRSRVVAKIEKFKFLVEFATEPNTEKSILNKMEMDFGIRVFGLYQDATMVASYSDFVCPAELHSYQEPQN